MNPNDTILKTLRLRRETIETLQHLCEEERRPMDAVLQEALEFWLEARAKARLEEELHDEQAQSRLSYDEFWDGVDL